MDFLTLSKILVSASIIALASEFAKKSTLVAAITLALPLTSILALVWVNYETHDMEKLISISWGIFWLVPPSLAFFPMFAMLLGRNFSFWLAFLLASLMTVGIYFLYAKLLAFFGIKI